MSVNRIYLPNSLLLILQLAPPFSHLNFLFMSTHHTFQIPPTYHTSLTQLVKVSVNRIYLPSIMSLFLILQLAPPFSHHTFLFMPTHHTFQTPPTYHTSLTQLVKVSVNSSYVQSDLSSSSYSSWPHPLHTTPLHHLPALSEGPVQSRVSWLLKATVHCQPSRADCQSGPGPQGKE